MILFLGEANILVLSLGYSNFLVAQQGKENSFKLAHGQTEVYLETENSNMNCNMHIKYSGITFHTKGIVLPSFHAHLKW